MTDSCTYRFRPDEWTQEHDRPCHVDEAWSCPHEAVDGAERCLFHLGPAQRRDRDVDGETVADALADLAASDGARSKAIIGASLSDVDLTRTILDAPDRQPLDLRHATVSGRLSFTDAELRVPLDLRGARIDSVDWREATLAHGCRLTDARIDGRFAVSNATFESDVDLEGVRFGGAVDAAESRFHADTCLRDTVFAASATFDGVEFRGDANLLDDDACFERARFAEGASFRKAQFRYADFVDCDFGGEVDFDEATFTGDAEFADATFRRRASFRGATFEGDADVIIDDADFTGAAFRDVADFDHATFAVGCFADATFDEDAVFTDAAFDEDAVFAGAVFADAVVCTEARFREDADFSAVTVEGDAIFTGAEFHGGDNVEDDDLTFEDAAIAGHADFQSVRAQFVNFRSLSASDATYANATVGDDAVFADATFDGDLTLSECQFKGDTSFAGTAVTGTLTAHGAEFHGRDNVDDDDATFADATFGDDVDFFAAKFRYATFRSAAIAGDARFDRTSFDDDAVFTDVEVAGTTTFDEARFRDDAAFANAEFGGPVTFDGVEFQGGDNVQNDDVTFANADFGDDVSFESVRFRYAAFPEAAFGGAANFHDTAFDRPAVFSDSRFAGPVTFTEARFRHDVAFDGATFDSDATFSGAEFHGGDNVEDDDVTFERATFDDDAAFDRVEFAYTNFRSVRVRGEAAFTASTFLERATFDDAAFDGRATFSEAVFEDDATFAGCAIDGDASFFGVEFEGGTSEDEDVAFTEATFRGDVDFGEIECDDFGMTDAVVSGSTSFTGSRFGRVVADGAEFGGSADLSYTRYTDQSSFVGATFGGEAELDETRFMSDVCFAEASFDRGASFRGAEFEGGSHTVDDADFEAARFGDTADFKLAEFRYADFSGVEFDDTAIFVETTFTDDGLFQRAEFAGSALFSRTIFRQGADFSSAAFIGSAHFDEVEFDADTTFADAHFDDDAVFAASEFRGSANRHADDASFESATFAGTADFETVSFRYANFAKTAFGERGEFGDATFADAVAFRPQSVEGDEVLIDFTGATIAAGTLGQPEAGSAFYDCTRCVFGDVTLDDAHCSRELFDYFRLCDTDFDGFDFTTHKAHLAENDWIIHEFGASDELLAGDDGAITNPATLENTYLRAKNCASDFGDRKAAAEFFVREMLYRRQKNRHIATGQSIGSVTDVSFRTRVGAAGKWVGNTILYETCGYGERLWRVLYVSVAAIFIWGLVYTLMPTGVEGGGTRTLDSVAHLLTPEGIAVLGRNMYFSTATFITLEYVSGAPGGSMARWLASLEAFTGALLIALVVFVLGRRVAW